MIKKIDTINYVINYYIKNEDNVINCILNKNNTIMPDVFEKNIVKNTYKSLIELI